MSAVLLFSLLGLFRSWGTSAQTTPEITAALNCIDALSQSKQNHLEIDKEEYLIFPYHHNEAKQRKLHFLVYSSNESFGFPVPEDFMRMETGPFESKAYFLDFEMRLPNNKISKWAYKLSAEQFEDRVSGSFIESTEKHPIIANASAINPVQVQNALAAHIQNRIDPLLISQALTGRPEAQLLKYQRALQPCAQVKNHKVQRLVRELRKELLTRLKSKQPTEPRKKQKTQGKGKKVTFRKILEPSLAKPSSLRQLKKRISRC